jgi:hypothetical protein
LVNLAEAEDWGLEVLVPEVWEKETLKHLRDWASLRIGEIERASRVAEFGTPDQHAATNAFYRQWSNETPDSLASRLFQQHLKAVRAKRLSTAWNRGQQVLDNYFASLPPFEASGTKKAEFPDAFALTSLEEWSEQVGRKVLVVTNDKGCLAACEASKNLIGFPNLLDALAAISAADEARRKDASIYAATLKARLASEAEPLWKAIEPSLVRALEDMEVDLNVNSHVQDYGQNVDSVNFSRVVHWPTEGDISVLSIGPHTLSFVWRLDVELDVEARFYRTFGRKTANANLHWGTPSSHASTAIEVEIVVTLQSTKPMSPEGVEESIVRSVELIDRSFSIDFGDVEPWEPDYEE